ncbi:DoxX family protein [Bradyrhizobium sp. SK17]|uniref:DoxX family protein n=1 Tax=Bradyrhizobium sp. SK17 TaxID=2057741 RepID=UPI000C312E16|nr:DoxX family protein [Bradyrhizobium sp. SK17]AUC97880.1 DoxX family protein [Bradyrhizobium sp. SK17]
MSARADTPSLIRGILAWPGLWPAVRLALVSAYLIGGFTKLFDFAGAIAEQEHFGLRPGWLWAALAIIVELGGSALVVAGRWVWFGAGGLGVLTWIAMLTANNFWALQGREHFMALNAFFEHLGLIAGLVLVAMTAVKDKPA